MRHRVHARGGGDRGRQRAGRVRVEDREPRVQREIGELELDLCLGVLDHRGERDLGPGARGRGNARERSDRMRGAHAVVLAGQQEEALQVARRAAVGEEDAGGLGGVHHGSAAHGEQRVGAGLARRRRAGLDHVRRGVLRHVVEHAGHVEAAVGHARLDPLDEPRAPHDGIGHHEHAVGALLGELEAGRAQHLAPRDDAGGRAELGEVPEAQASRRSSRPDCSSICR